MKYSSVNFGDQLAVLTACTTQELKKVNWLNIKHLMHGPGIATFNLLNIFNQ